MTQDFSLGIRLMELNDISGRVTANMHFVVCLKNQKECLDLGCSIW